MKRFMRLALLAVSFSIVVSFASASDYPLSTKDDSGSSVVIKQKPQRIVSLTLPSDELLFSLVDATRIAAVTTFAADPAVSNVSALAAKIPLKLALNVEPVLAAKPDLVLVSSWSDAGKVKQLRDAGVAVYMMNSPVSIADIEAMVRTVARLVSEEAKGEAIVATMEQKLADVKQRVGKLAANSRASALDYNTWGAASAKGSSWDEALGRAGIVNAVASIKADQYGQVPLSKEILVSLNPTILFLPSWVYGDPQGADNFLKSVKADPSLQGLSAIKSGKLFMVPEYFKSTTSQFIADAVVFLARTAYPELFK